MNRSLQQSRRSFMVGSLAVATITVLQAGCSSNAPASGPPVAPTAPTAAAPVAKPTVAPKATTVAQAQAPLTVKLAPKATGATAPAIEQQTATLFEKQYPNLRVQLDITASGGYYTKLLAEIAGGDPPDSARVDDYFLAPTAARHGIDALDPYIKADSSFKLDDFNKVSLQNGQYQGQQFGLPLNLNSYVLFYNATAFEEAGLPTPPTDATDPTWTWQHFLDICPKLLKTSGRITQRWAFMWDATLISRLSAHVYAMDGPFVDDPMKPTKLALNDPKSVDAIQFLADLRNKHHLAPAPSDMIDSGGNDGMFQAGRLATYISLPFAAGSAKKAIKDKFKWDLAPMPHLANGSPGDTAISNCYVVLAASKHKDAAWNLATFWTSTQIQQLHTLVPDETPARISALPAVQELTPPPKNMDVFVKAHAYSLPIMHTPVYDQMEQQVLSGLDLVWTGKQTAKDAIAQLTPKVDALLQGKS